MYYHGINLYSVFLVRRTEQRKAAAMTTVKSEQPNLIIRNIKYVSNEREISKDNMYTLVEYMFHDCKSIDIDIDWANLHDEDHPITDRQTIIDVINNLFRSNGIHAKIIGETINNSIIEERRDPMQVEILKFELYTRAQYNEGGYETKLTLPSGTYFSLRDALKAMYVYKAQVDRQSVVPYSKIRFVIDCCSTGVVIKKIYEFKPKCPLELIEESEQVNHVVRREMGLSKIRVDIRNQTT